jgi:hypothetical protein
MSTNSTISSKTPTTGYAPVGSGVGLGVTPTHSYVMPYRMCEKANGITYPVAICVTCKKIIEPVNKEFSKTGSHGRFYYVHEHPLVFVTLIQSNSGKRKIVWTGGYIKVLNEVIEYAWIVNGQSIEEVTKIIKTSMRVM